MLQVHFASLRGGGEGEEVYLLKYLPPAPPEPMPMTCNYVYTITHTQVRTEVHIRTMSNYT